MVKALVVKFNDNGEPMYEFTGDWNIRDLGRVRNTLFRAFKHYMKEIRLQNKEEVK